MSVNIVLQSRQSVVNLLKEFGRSHHHSGFWSLFLTIVYTSNIILQNGLLLFYTYHHIEFDVYVGIQNSISNAHWLPLPNLIFTLVFLQSFGWMVGGTELSKFNLTGSASRAIIIMSWLHAMCLDMQYYTCIL